jgi:hypothetical protein
MKHIQCEHKGCNNRATHEAMVSFESRHQGLIFKSGRKKPVGMYRIEHEQRPDLIHYCEEHLPKYFGVLLKDGMVVCNSIPMN